MSLYQSIFHELVIFFAGYACALLLVILRFPTFKEKHRVMFFLVAATSHLLTIGILWRLLKNRVLTDGIFLTFCVLGLFLLVILGFIAFFRKAEHEEIEFTGPEPENNSSIFRGNGIGAVILIITGALVFLAASSAPAFAVETPAIPGKPGFSEITTTSVKISWNANGNPASAEYEVERKGKGKNWFAVGITTDTFLNETGLASDRGYSYRVRSINSAGQESLWSETGSFRTNPPGVPVVTVFSSSVLVYGNSTAPPLEFTCDQDSDYEVQLGGDGSPGNGSLLYSGTVKAGVKESMVLDRDTDLEPDNTVLDIFVTCLESGAPLNYGFKKRIVYDDHTAPVATVDYPNDGQILPDLSHFSGITTDTAGGNIALVELRLYNVADDLYWDNETSAFSATVPEFFAALGGENWIMNADGMVFVDTQTYSISARAIDAGGNVGPISGSISFIVDKSLPKIAIESPNAALTIIGPDVDAVIMWRVDMDGDYYLRIGGSGEIISGVDAGNGFVQAGETIRTEVPAASFQNNNSEKLFIIVRNNPPTAVYDYRSFLNDQAPPVTELETELTEKMKPPAIIEGNSSDDVAGLESVELAIRDGYNMYYNPAANLFTPTTRYFGVDGLSSWSFVTEDVPWLGAVKYTILARAKDKVGNVEEREIGSFRAVVSSEMFFSNKKKKRSGGGCFLATACYESRIPQPGSQIVINSTGKYVISSVNHEKLNTLRAFRDGLLSRNAAGRAFIRLYYRTSPPLASAIRARPFERAMVRWLVVTPTFILAREIMNESYMLRTAGFILLLLVLISVRRRRLYALCRQ